MTTQYYISRGHLTGSGTAVIEGRTQPYSGELASVEVDSEDRVTINDRVSRLRITRGKEKCQGTVCVDQQLKTATFMIKRCIFEDSKHFIIRCKEFPWIYIEISKS
jgi:hypothetical protein